MKIISKTKRMAAKKPRTRPVIKKKRVKKPKFCQNCDGKKGKGHKEGCPVNENLIMCNNNLKDCWVVENSYDTCDVCKAVWDKVITITSDGDNPHLPTVFEEAAEKFKDNHGERFHDNLYSFGIKLIDREFIYYDFGDRNHWDFTFKAVKK